MDIAKKIEIVATAVASIASHSDEDSVVLLAALGAVEKIVLDAKLGIVEATSAAAAQAIAPKVAS